MILWNQYQRSMALIGTHTQIQFFVSLLVKVMCPYSHSKTLLFVSTKSYMNVFVCVISHNADIIGENKLCVHGRNWLDG